MMMRAPPCVRRKFPPASSDVKSRRTVEVEASTCCANSSSEANSTF